MIDTKELRSAVESAGLNAISREEVLELLDSLEAAGKELAFAKAKIDRLHDDIYELTDERDALRAKIERMEQQEPDVWMQSTHLSSFKNRLCGSQSSYVHCSDHQLHPDFKPLYALPGAKGEEK